MSARLKQYGWQYVVVDFLAFKSITIFIRDFFYYGSTTYPTQFFYFPFDLPLSLALYFFNQASCRFIKFSINLR